MKNIKQIQNRIKKLNSSWHIPFSTEDAQKLFNYVDSLLMCEIETKIEDNIYNILGDDELFDRLHETETRYEEEVASIIRDSVKEIYFQYQRSPETFSDKFEPGALEYLEKIINLKYT